MTPFIVQAVSPTSDNLRDGYVAAPAEITNWVTFNTGSTILIDPNSKVTVNIIFKIPPSYKNPLPKNWQFDISAIPQITTPSSVEVFKIKRSNKYPDSISIPLAGKYEVEL